MIDTQEMPTAQARIRREWKEPQWLMPLIDGLLVVLAFILAYVARYDLQILRPVDEPNRAPFHPYIPYVIVFILWLYLNYRGSGLYRVKDTNGAPTKPMRVLGFCFLISSAVLQSLGNEGVLVLMKINS